MFLLGTVACAGRAFRVVVPERIVASVLIVALVAIG